MASFGDLLFGGSAIGVLLVLLFFVLFPVWVLVALWRIGTGLKDLAFAFTNEPGRKSMSESAELQAEALAALVNKKIEPAGRDK